VLGLIDVINDSAGYVIAWRILPEQASELSPETWALCCLLHKIGTAEIYFKTTRMSYDIYSGIKAREFLKCLGSAHDQADAVAEAIIRHKDMGDNGTITLMGQMIQLATLYDDVGKCDGVKEFGELVNELLRHNVNTTFRRLHWTTWFGATIRAEEENKPWCRTTHDPQVNVNMAANTVQKPWE
jgi:cyanamide hydratase